MSDDNRKAVKWICIRTLVVLALVIGLAPIWAGIPQIWPGTPQAFIYTCVVIGIGLFLGGAAYLGLSIILSGMSRDRLR